jgi:hypothetical protein
MDRKLGGPQSRPGRCGEDNNLLPLPAIEARSSPQLVTIQTELSQLHSIEWEDYYKSFIVMNEIVRY